MSASKKLVPDWVESEVEAFSPAHPHFTLDATIAILAGPLSAPQYLNCSQAMPGDAALMAIRYTARDWRGVANANGQPVKFSPRNLDLLFADARMMEALGILGGKIVQRSFLTEEERKN